MIQRRNFLKTTSLAGLALSSGCLLGAEDIASKSEAFVPIRAVTKGPGFHWFGYYDKLNFSASDTKVLCNRVDFEGRTPTADDEITVGVIDLEDGDKWTTLGTSKAWGWQQGCMLQWRPGSENEVMWNDREDGKYVSRIHNLETGETRTLPRAIYTVSPDGKWALSLDFGRLQRLRPGYGYVGIGDQTPDEKAPEEAGIWRMDLETGASLLIVSNATVAALPYQGKSLEDKWHYFNHLLVSPDAKRFIFLHRWRQPGKDGPDMSQNFTTRMFTVNADGTDLFELDPSGNTSHFIWRDPATVTAWTKPVGKKWAFYHLKDKDGAVEIVGEKEMPTNGHNTYLSIGDGKTWILNDTYPIGGKRQQIPFVFNTSTGKKQELGKFHSPDAYKGEWRCDTHPRSSNNGKLVTIDSPHAGTGRQMYLLDVSEIVE